MGMTNTHRATWAHDLAGVTLALDRAEGMGWDLTEGEGAAEPLAVEVAPAPQVDSVLLPQVPAWVSEVLPQPV